jgi:hypothetical protein
MFLDVAKMYTCQYLDPTKGPKELQNKVQWDIRFYFARRGKENFSEMTKQSFKVLTDPATGLKYVKKAIDELDKSHKENHNEEYSGVMPQLNDPRWCPVKSFEVYLTLLHPDSNYLWQQLTCTSFQEEGTPHYGPSKAGHNTLDKFVRNLSHLCNITPHYTNHCLRATGVTILKRAKYSDKQIMSVTGHHSHASLDIYNNVSANEKMMMGYTLGYSLFNPTVIPMVQAENASVAPVVAKPSTITRPATPQHMDTALTDISNTTNESNCSPPLTFQNCTFNNVTFNICKR